LFKKYQRNATWRKLSEEERKEGKCERKRRMEEKGKLTGKK
jgi:hypothetical protein